jgi:uncharacterized protein
MNNYFFWMLLLMAVGFGVQMYLKQTYGRFSQIRNSRDLTGAEVARDILDANNLHNVKVEQVPGELSDHYDPISKTVRLSENNYSQPSLAALAVAAHEVGHALQDAQGYPAIVARARFFPVLSIGTNLGPWLAFAGIFLGASSFLGGTLLWLGVLGFGAALAFHMITLPVEFDASRRALVILEGRGYLSSTENNGAKAVLTAAALTYVVAFVSALISFLHILGIARSSRN